MIQITQTPQSKINKLKAFLKATKYPDERDSARAILKLIEGRKRQDVADFYDIHIKTLDEWQRAFKRQGIEGLMREPQIGNNYKLSYAQKEEIKTAINNNTPDELQQKGRFWKVSLLKQYVKKRYNVVYKSEVSYQDLFTFCGFSYHKPDKVNKRQNPHMRKQFEDTLKKSSNGTVEKIAWYW